MLPPTLSATLPYLFLWMADFALMGHLKTDSVVYVGFTASMAMRNAMILPAIFVFLPAFYLLFPYLGNNGLWLALQVFMISRGLSMWLLARKAVYRL